MRLRIRLAQELRARLDEHLPLADVASWDATSAPCVMDDVRVEYASDVESDWQRAAAIEGMMRAELHGEGVEDRVVEPLIASLLDDVLLLAPDPGAAAGALSEQARAMLIGWREEIRDGRRIPVLQFRVTGALLRKLPAQGIPDLYASQAPDIGAAHIDDYIEIG